MTALGQKDHQGSPASVRGFLIGGDVSIMGIVNVTPDSFSDGGDHATAEAAIAHGRKLLDQGAHCLDIGGESTRPGADPVTPAEEQRRILPVVETLAAEGAVVSVDTRNASTMMAAMSAGAMIINDVTALEHDAESLKVVAETGAHVVLMHMKGNPRNMQDEPAYNDVVEEVYSYLEDRVSLCREAGVPLAKIAIDPGIGFAKTDKHNLALIGNLDRFKDLGCGILLGVSRKSMIGRIAGESDPKARLAGSLALALAGVERGATLLRVHDVAETRQAVALWTAL